MGGDGGSNSGQRRPKSRTHVVNYFAKPWSYEMAYRMGKRSEGDIFGKILMFIGIPICELLGMLSDSNLFSTAHVNHLNLIFRFYKSFFAYLRTRLI